MNKLSIAVCFAAALAMQAANAGSHPNIPVHIGTDSTGAKFARGSMHSARESSDNKQFIGCHTGLADPATAFIICSATDAAGHSLHCNINTPAFAGWQQVVAINSASTIQFTADSNFVCTAIQVDNNSGNL